MKVNKQTNSEKTLFVGTGLVQILCFNPSRNELDKVLGIERDADYVEKPEFEYVKEDYEMKQKDKEGNEIDSIYCKRLTVTCWVKENKTEEIFPMNFTLYDVDDVSSTGKTKFVTQHGKSTYVDSAENLPSWFTQTPGKKKFTLNYRPAKKGEASLLEFLAAWTNISPFDVESSLFLDNEKKFWNGDMKELNNLIADFEDNSVMVNFGVRTKEEETEEGSVTKEYQAISTKAFCQSSFMKFFRNYANKNWEGLLKDGESNFDTFDTKAKIGDTSMYSLANYMNNIFGEYGVKEFSKKVEIEQYNSEENPLNNEKSLVEDTASSDY
jgi:hypothetical protein